MTPRHPLDVYTSLFNTAEPMLHVMAWMKNTLFQGNALSWQDWFQHPERDALEALCVRAFREVAPDNRNMYFAESLGYWRKETLFNDQILDLLITESAHMPEATWHALVDHHGVKVTLELVEAMERRDPLLFIFKDILVKEQQELVALPLRLGMFDNDVLAKPYGLDRQSLEFWARRVAASGKNKSWRAFCTQYPWHGPELVQTLLQRPHLLECTGTSFLETWMHNYPDQYRALHTFLFMKELPCLAALPAVGQMDATTLNQQCALLSGLYASTPYLSEHVQNYCALFATPACTGALPLPELDIT